MLGWDVTDFGSGDFVNIGRVLFTLRNGRSNDPRYPKSYAEKLLIDPENQRAPAHFHRSKREDIICRHGGNILVQLTKATPEGGLARQLPEQQGFGPFMGARHAPPPLPSGAWTACSPG
jgi:D-lyxose ketol-isomerase